MRGLSHFPVAFFYSLLTGASLLTPGSITWGISDRRKLATYGAALTE
jgi:hypothetical protein